MTGDQMLGILTGEMAGPLLQSALTGLPQGQVPGFRHQVDRIQRRQGDISVCYRVWYDTPDGELNDYLVATTAAVQTASRVQVAGRAINVWRHPADPELPGLTRLDQLRVTPDDQVDMLVYRPLRRAVLRSTPATGRPGTGRFAKVVRPKVWAQLERRQQIFAAAGLGPAVLHSDPAGVLVLATARGLSLANLLSGWQRGQLDRAPGPAELVAALDRLPAQLSDLTPEPSWTDRTAHHVELAVDTLPEQAAEIRRLGERISELAARLPAGEMVPTHGDCYEANVFWDGNLINFIDVDRSGPGHRVDDLGCMLAHLAVLPELSPAHYPGGQRVVAEWYREFEQHCDPGALCVRVAGVLLSLVAGCPPESALHRLDLVRAWLNRAEAAAACSA